MDSKEGKVMGGVTRKRMTHHHHHKQAFLSLVVQKQGILIHLARQQGVWRSSGVDTCECSLLGR